MLHKTFKALFSLTSLCTLAAASQYNVIILNPDPDTYGSGQAASAGKQYGAISPASNPALFRATAWALVPGAGTNLHPPFSLAEDSSQILAADGDYQWGRLIPAATNVPLEYYWQGTPESAKPIPKGDFEWVRVMRSRHGIACGYGLKEGQYHALYWPTPSSDPVSLGTGLHFARIWASDGLRQVGQTSEEFGQELAAIWSSTPESRVMLHPDAHLGSTAFVLEGEHQFGTVFDSGPVYKAVKWSGTKESMQYLHPDGYFGSFILTGRNGVQVGRAFLASDSWHAAAWQGTKESFVDLHSFLPGEFFHSQALDVDEEGRVIGRGYLHPILTEGDATKAVLWVPIRDIEYGLTGFLRPINPAGWPENVFNLGRNIPLKLRVTNPDGTPATNLTLSLSVTEIGPADTASKRRVPTPGTVEAASEGVLFSFDRAGQQYIYNLSTKGMRTGYRYRATALIAESNQTVSTTFVLQ